MLEFAHFNGATDNFKLHSEAGGIYELRSYRLKPRRMLEWENEWKKGIEARKQFIQPVGAWFAQLGHLNYVHHLWAYPDLAARKILREKSWAIEGWSNTVHKTGIYV